MKLDIRTITNEEIINFINESYNFENENLKFSQKVNSMFYNYNSFSNDYDTDITESDIQINWHIGFMISDLGIENFQIAIDSIVGTFNVEYYDKQSDELIQNTNKSISDIRWTYHFNNANLIIGKSLYIESADFDIDKKLCIINFNESEI